MGHAHDDDFHRWWTVSEDEQAATVLAGRYRLLSPLGQGGGGEVFVALDLLEGREVAVKRLRAVGEAGQARVRREVGALRLLDLPGVVRILDDGVHEGRAFLVMERVVGAPFPGEGRVGWPALEGPTTSLLRTLARVHEAGVVHRDVKPGNVLVTADGQAVLLDFGLARGDAVGPTITRTGAVMGTPRYLAPEQLVGERAGPRADLYAVGVMLYEALAGCPPHEADDLEGLWRLRLRETPLPLDRRVPELPPNLVELVARLLAIDPAARPATATAALDALSPAAPHGGRMLPWLGSRAIVDALVATASEGRPLDLHGPPGSGRTTALREAGAVLAAQGHRVAWARPGGAPFQSLGPLLDLPEAGAAPDAMQAARASLDAFLQAGGVLLVDGPGSLDRWSRGLLGQVTGAVLTAVDAPVPGRATLALPALSTADLLPLFHGPERLLHLPSDAASELHRRSRGLPGAVVAELRAWIAAGLCAWDEGRLCTTREALDRLRAGLRPRADEVHLAPLPLDEGQRALLAWIQLAGAHAHPDLLARVVGRPRWQLDLELAELADLGALRAEETGGVVLLVDHDLAASWPGELRRDAHAALAGALPPGTEGRLFHVLASGLLSDLADEALATAHRHRQRGRVGEAEATLREAARALRREGDAAGEARLLPALVRTAVAASTLRAAERARYEVQRALAPPPWLLPLCEAAVLARSGDPDQALADTAALGPLPDPEAELARQHVRMLAAQHRPEAAEAVIEDLRSLSEARGDTELAGLVPMWRGLLRFRQGRYQEAAALHEQSAALRTQQLGRLSARVNAAMAWLEAGDLDRAEHLARLIVAEAAETRAPYYEVQGEWVQRSARASRRDGALPDWELVQAVQALGDPARIGVVCMTEAVIAWHAGQKEECVRLARLAKEGHERAGNHEGSLWAEAALAMADPEWEGDVERMVAAATEMSAEVALDVLGMLAAAGRVGDEVAPVAKKSRANVKSLVARGMLSPVESLDRVLVRGGCA
ncbi:protein kinase [Myxococcota bacterium]|nr:protein kinase [Myxococcota bacterium]